MNKNKNKIKSTRYIFFLFISFSFFFLKVSNCLLDLGKEIKSLNYLVYILKSCYLGSTNFALEFLDRKSLKTQKKIYINYLKKSYLAFLTFTAFNMTNHYHLIKEYLEFPLSSYYWQDLEI